MEDETVQVPTYFICPISLEIMKDPVTAATGITYDRDAIEYWLSTAQDVLCPVTRHPLPRHSDLTPNHTLRRLIQAWCVDYGIDRIPTPRPPLSKSHVLKLLPNLSYSSDDQLFIKSLDTLYLLANENEKNRRCLAEAGATGAMVSLITRLSKERLATGLCQALKVLNLIWLTVPAKKQIAKEDEEFMESLLWLLGPDLFSEVQTEATLVLGKVMEVATATVLERLKLEFFKQTINVIRKRISPKAVKAALRLLIEVCPWGRNRMKMVEAGAVFELVELEIDGVEKNVSELVFVLLAYLCSCADGRAQLTKHAGGIALVAKRMLRVSPATDDRAVHILSLIGKFSATDEVVAEMMLVGAVCKLCMVLQVDYAPYIKKKSREILKMHSYAWNNSPCMPLYLLTR